MFRIVFTPGEPAGIGPDLIIQLAQQNLPGEIIVVADAELLQQRAKQLKLPLYIVPFVPHQQTVPAKPSYLNVLHVPLIQPCRAGQLAKENATYVLKTLTIAGQGCLDGVFNALVTGPLQKGIINEAGIPFKGHTEFLAELTQSKQPVMMLVAPGLRVALATTHLPLAAVPAAITQESLRQVLTILNADLKSRFKIAKPNIYVCGLNPHAGENGHLGHEEIEIIQPVIANLRQQGMCLTGPLPADTIFTPKYLAHADAILAMYHDQGLPVLKYKGFGNAVNVTLGLPIIRTSVDHGTALDLAGTGTADTGSLSAAIQLAIELLKK